MVYIKYYKYKEEVSYDNGDTWQYTGSEAPSGDPISMYDTLKKCEASNQYLTIVPREDGTITKTDVRSQIPERGDLFYYSYDLNTWYEATSATTITMRRGQNVYFKSTSSTGGYTNGMGHFVVTGAYDVEGNIKSMKYGDEFRGVPLSEPNTYLYSGLFMDSTTLVSAENLILPDLVVNIGIYQAMFSGCTSLIAIPDLPATGLTQDDYYHMFAGCTSLTTAMDVLPAMVASPGCYNGMFLGCTSLVNPPRLPATTLNTMAYYDMFQGCTSLVIPPELPATTLYDACYVRMFANCTSLIKSPVMRIGGNVSWTGYGTYDYMFSGCQNLTEITSLSTDGRDYTHYAWVLNVSPTGTFYKNPDANWTIGASGIPSGWTVVDYTC